MSSSQMLACFDLARVELACQLWHDAGERDPPDREGWLDENPLGVPTEREVQTNSTNGRCYRVMLVRNSTPV